MGFLESIKEIKEKISYTKEIEFEGVKVLLGLLTVNEERLVNTVTEGDQELEGMSYVNDVRKRVLSYAIKSIGNEVIPEIVEYVEGDKQVRQTRNVYLYDFLSGVPTSGVDILFEVYTDLKDEVEDSIEKKIKVNWYLTPSEREIRRKEEFKRRELESNNLIKEQEEERLSEEGREDIKFREIKNKDVETEDDKKSPKE
jgi:hypothetical protein